MLSRGAILRVYQLGSVIGQGGFGIVYAGRHRELRIDVAIKEYFPTELSVRQEGRVAPKKPEYKDSFEEGLDRFLQEAKQLEKFRDCPTIVSCRDLFRANGTAYMVMDYIPGLSLSSLLQERESRGDPFTENDLLRLILPLLYGLETIHASGVYHQDIKPSNILVRRVDGDPILIDFGAAKHKVSKHTKSFAPYTDGYAAMEQVGDGQIGPWTDVYGVGSVMWRMVAGGAPPFSPPNPLPIQQRAYELMQGLADPLPSAKEIGRGRFSESILQAIDDCLCINVRERLQNCSRLIEKLPAGSAPSRHTPNLDSNPSHKKITPVEDSLSQKSFEEELLQYAKKGDARSQWMLGVAYANGQYGVQDYHAALKWLRYAAKQGYAKAQYELGNMYRWGWGVIPNYQESLKWLTLAAEQGDEEVQYELGNMYRRGRGVPRNYQEAIKWWKLAVEKGHVRAQYELASMYRCGQGVDKSYEEAVKYYRFAAEQGDVEASYELTRMVEIRKGMGPESMKWCRLAAEQGHPSALYKMGRMYANGQSESKNFRLSVKSYQLAAKQGHVGAHFRLRIIRFRIWLRILWENRP